MKLFIAEKPDLARDIVNGLCESGEKFELKDGFYQSGNYCVTWCYGHVLEMVEPEQINPSYAEWRMEDLPLKLYPVRLKPKANTSKQVKIILDLIRKADSIVNAGDPDDEGQLLVDEILIYCNNKKPVERLLINDNTNKAVVEALNNMKSNNMYKGLYLKALARSISDAIYGLSMTRAVTIQLQKNGNKGIYSIGRVQTPVLALIVKRYLENKNHQKSSYFVINGTFNSSLNGYWKATETAPLDDKKRLINKEYALSIVKKVSNKNGYIINKVIDDKEISPPLPYNLVKLQQDMNKLFGYSSSKTVEITQELREKFKAITYNRSDCSYLSDEQYQKSPELIAKLKSINNYKSFEFDSNIKSNAFDNSKITAHTAIIPSDNIPDISKLTSSQKNVYLAITERFLCQFLPNKKYQTLTISINVEDETFVLKSSRITCAGFTSFLKDDNEDIVNDSMFDILSNLSINDSIMCNSAAVEEKETKPLPLFTEASLLAALVRVADFVEDPKIKQLLRDKDRDKKDEHGGIGMPATRHLMIEILKKRGFIELDKKNLIPTPLGLSYCKALPSKVLLPDLTALLSEQQELIQKGELSIDEFVNKLYEDITNLISELDVSSIKTYENELSTNCPKCNNKLISKEKFIQCKICDFKIWKTIAGKTLSKSQINVLLEKKSTGLIDGFISKTGKKFKAKLELVDNTVKFKFD